MCTWWSLLCLAVLAAIAGAAGCMAPSTPSVSPSPAQAVPSTVFPSPSGSPAGTLNLHVDSLTAGSLLPDIYTCKGPGESPGVSWDGIPAGTKSLVLILDDPDTPSGTFTHWLVYNIPPVTGSFSRGQPSQKVLANGAQQGDNTAGSRGYYPPCPPVGATHRYIFRIFAVDMEIIQPSANRESIDAVLEGHTLGKTEFVTSFTR